MCSLICENIFTKAFSEKKQSVVLFVKKITRSFSVLRTVDSRGCCCWRWQEDPHMRLNLVFVVLVHHVGHHFGIFEELIIHHGEYVGEIA